MSTPEKNAQSIIALQKDFEKLGLLVERMDATLEKLTELQAGISQILAVQENRISNLERQSDGILNQIEERRKDSETNFKDLRTDEGEHQQKLLSELQKNREEPKKMIDEIHARIDKIERWFFISMGVVITLGMIVDKIDFAKIFG